MPPPFKTVVFAAGEIASASSTVWESAKPDNDSLDRSPGH
jgi:hypothetical protein